jgi:ATP-dependent Lhr-like helicase
VRADVRSALAGRPFGSRAALRRAPALALDRRSRERSGGERWFALDSSSGSLDALTADEISREKARRLLGRYGCLSRSIAGLETGAPPWSALFRALRLMEFAGEVTGGRFYDGLDELQFIRADEAASISVPPLLYCLCARDPASLCGLQPLAAELRLPARVASNHVVWRGSTPILVSKRNGRELDFRVPSDSAEAVAAVTALARRLVGRAVDPLGKLLVETIGGESSVRSPYAATLRSAHFVEDPKGLSFYPGGIA